MKKFLLKKFGALSFLPKELRTKGIPPNRNNQKCARTLTKPPRKVGKKKVSEQTVAEENSLTRFVSIL
eukprot:3755091-Amphidinium_carterae.1